MSITSRSIPTPSQLLFSLLHNDFKQIECEDDRQSIKKQIQFLNEEILFYQEQREKKVQFQKELEIAIEVRARLRVELQRLSRERRLLDMDAVDFVQRVKMDPIEIRSLAKYEQELNEVRDQNCKMKVKLRELQDYANMLQKRIEIQQKENNIIQPTEILEPIVPAPMILLDRFGDLDWRQKIRAYKLEQKIYTENFKGNLQYQISKTSVALQELNNQHLTGLHSGSKEFWRNFPSCTTNLDLWKRTF